MAFLELGLGGGLGGGGGSFKWKGAGTLRRNLGTLSGVSFLLFLGFRVWGSLDVFWRLGFRDFGVVLGFIRV